MFVNPADAARLFEGEKGYLQCDNMIYVAEPHDSVNPGSIAFNSFQRRSIGLAMGSSCQVSTFQPPTDNFNISELTLTVDTTRPMNVEIDGKRKKKKIPKKQTSAFLLLISFFSRLVFGLTRNKQASLWSNS